MENVSGFRRRAFTYPVVGALLALGAPLGLLLLRSALTGHLPSPSWALAEVARDPVLYAYLTLSTGVIFALAGYLLGRSADRWKELATSDALTGLFNRRYFDMRLHDELARAERYGMPLSLLLVDLDGLKPLNDRHGHEAGDQVLCMIGDALRATCRRSDVIARIGGDEFGVLAPFTNADEAFDLAERLRSAVASRPTPWGRMTVSVGVADRARISADERLLAAADRALYTAKAAGKNQSSLPPPTAVAYAGGTI